MNELFKIIHKIGMTNFMGYLFSLGVGGCGAFFYFDGYYRKQFPERFITEENAKFLLLKKIREKCKATLDYSKQNLSNDTLVKFKKGAADIYLQPEFRIHILDEEFYIRRYFRDESGIIYNIWTKADHEVLIQNLKSTLNSLNSNLQNDFIKEKNRTMNNFVSHAEIKLKVEEIFRKHNIYNPDWYSENFNSQK